MPTLKLTKDGAAIKIGTRFECSKTKRHVLHVRWAKNTSDLILADHGLVWPQHQNGATRQAYARLAKELASRGAIDAELELGQPYHVASSERPGSTPRKGLGKAAKRNRSETGARFDVARIPRLQTWKGIPSQPTLVHADWSGSQASKRWYSIARWSSKQEKYVIAAPEPIAGDVASWLDEQLRISPLMLGFDFVNGLPRAYHPRKDFLAFLDHTKKMPLLLTKVRTLAEVGKDRPFFSGPGAKADMAQRILGTTGDAALLLRFCDQAKSYRGAAEALFWCKYGKQVGSATLHGWKNVVLPARARGVALWPFDGASLPELLRRSKQVIVETYPGDAYSVLGVAGNSKREPSWRRKAGRRILEVIQTEAFPIQLSAELRRMFGDGFGTDKEAEDRFDATVGALLMALVAVGRRTPGLPSDPLVRNKEGWILGCDA